MGMPTDSAARKKISKSPSAAPVRIQNRLILERPANEFRETYVTDHNHATVNSIRGPKSIFKNEPSSRSGVQTFSETSREGRNATWNHSVVRGLRCAGLLSRNRRRRYDGPSDERVGMGS